MEKSLSRPIGGVFAAVLAVSLLSCASTPKSGQSAPAVHENAEALAPVPQSTSNLPAEGT